MPRLALVAAVLLACAACSKPAPEKPADAPEGEKKLAVGMPAPPLQVAKWVKGDPVPAFEPGKAYVVEFWATWCAPCIWSMAHLSDLAKEYKAQGLVVVAVTTVDEQGNTPEAVDKFAAGRGKDLAFTIARCDTPDTREAYMDAANLNGYPATFVVGRDGTLAYLGRPDDLDEVLPKVLAGTWRGAEDARALREQDAELENILGRLEQARDLAQLGVGRSGDRAAAVAAINKAIAQAAVGVAADLDGYAAKYPGRAAKPTFQLNKAQVLLTVGRPDEARTVVAGVLDRGAAQKNADLLRMVVDLWTNPTLNPKRQYPEVAVKAADEWLAQDGGTVASLMTAAQAHAFAGDKAKAREYGTKALDKTPDPRQRAVMERALRQFEG